MKKIIVAVLAILYLTTSMGFTLHIHYCMGKFIDWDLRHNSSSICNNCRMKKADKPGGNGCCHDEFKHVKNNQDQRLSENFVQLNPTQNEITQVVLADYAISLPFLLSQENFKVNAPPRSCNSSIHIINCVFRI
ncbi:MAG: hypothetical protein ACHQF0_09135 [Chitinophagales bacterium]